MTWKQLRKQFEQGSTDAYVVALYKEGRKWAKKETQIADIEAAQKAGKELTPEQREKLENKAFILSKLEEVGGYYSLYKKAQKEQKGPKEEPKPEEPAAPEEESKDAPALTVVAQLIALQKVKGPQLSDHFSRKEQDVYHKLLQGGNYQLVSSIAEQVEKNLAHLIAGSEEKFQQNLSFRELRDKLSEKFEDADFKKTNAIRKPKQEKKDEHHPRKESAAPEEKPQETSTSPPKHEEKPVEASVEAEVAVEAAVDEKKDEKKKRGHKNKQEKAAPVEEADEAKEAAPKDEEAKQPRGRGKRDSGERKERKPRKQPKAEADDGFTVVAERKPQTTKPQQRRPRQKKD